MSWKHFALVLTPVWATSLRGVPRKLQHWTGNSLHKVVPQCKAGYNDVSGGSSYYWSCAFYCDGGQYYATEGCVCACLTPDQEREWRSRVTTTPPLPFDPMDVGTPEPGKILVTTLPVTTRTPLDPVKEFSAGELQGESDPRTIPSAFSVGLTGPPGLAGSAEYGHGAATTTALPRAINEAGLDWNVVLIAMLVAAGLAGTFLICLLFCNCGRLFKICCRRREEVKSPSASPPVLRLHADPGVSSMTPACFVEAPSSRASSKMSTASGTSLPLNGPSSRRSSKASTVSSQPQQDTSILLKLPRNDAAIATSSVESLSSWAREIRPGLQPPDVGRGRSSSRTSTCSQDSRSLQPPHGGSKSSARRSSRTSNASQDGTQSVSSTSVAMAGRSYRKTSKVQPVS